LLGSVPGVGPVLWPGRCWPSCPNSGASPTSASLRWWE
jgi:hypothetical protein